MMVFELNQSPEPFQTDLQEDSSDAKVTGGDQEQYADQHSAQSPQKSEFPNIEILSEIIYDRKEINHELTTKIKEELIAGSPTLRLTASTFPSALLLTELANDIEEVLREEKLELQSLILRHNKGIGLDINFEAFAKIVNMCKNMLEIDITNCELKSKDLTKFSEKIKQPVTVTKLCLDLNDGIANESGMSAVAEIVKRCQVQELSLAGCCIGSEQLEVFQEHDVTMEHIILNQNINMYPEDIIALAEKCQLKKISLRECEFNGDEKKEMEIKLPTVELLY